MTAYLLFQEYLQQRRLACCELKSEIRLMWKRGNRKELSKNVFERQFLTFMQPLKGINATEPESSRVVGCHRPPILPLKILIQRASMPSKYDGEHYDICERPPQSLKQTIDIGKT